MLVHRILLPAAALTLGGCWLLAEEEYHPPVKTDDPVTLQCPEDCSRQVCGTDGIVYCHSCDAINSGVGITDNSFCGLEDPSSSSSGIYTSSSSSSIRIPSSSSVYSSFPIWSSSSYTRPSSSSSYVIPPQSSSSATTCGCNTTLAPVCGSDGRTYINYCLAYCAQVYTLSQGACGLEFIPDASNLDAVAPYIEPVLEEMSPEDILTVQDAISNFVIPPGIDTMTSSEAEAAIQEAMVEQILTDPEIQLLLLRYLQ